MSNVKPGDMAKVIEAHPDCPGAIVEVLRTIDQHEAKALIDQYGVTHILERAPFWTVKVLTGAKGVSFGTHQYVYLLPGQEAVMRDFWLRRIDGPDPEREVPTARSVDRTGAQHL